MLNTSETIFIFILLLILAFILISLFVLMTKINRKRQELLDIEQHIINEYTTEVKKVEPAIVKQNIYFQPSSPTAPPVMTPKKRKSILYKIYGFRNPSTSPPLSPRKPSSIRPPSFLPMQENYHPPTYEDSVVLLNKY
ncbi:hypothetical protein G6F37_000745 [Rhizopus arrhizus]|nr:hypothetical protein G6F38_003782 [Rhizopus arrhizus]KAG1163931.1 hypothetical protein G6F37_000745 [Rhizopus arrhizus]